MLKVFEKAKLYVDIVDAGSFSKAAINTHSSNGKITNFVEALEKELKVTLFQRSTRKTQKTEAGEKYYLFCIDLLKQRQNLLENLRDNQDKIEGMISFSTLVTFGSEFIAPLVGKFLKKYPEIRISLDLSDKLRDLITENYDFAIRMAATLPDSTMRRKILIKSDWILCASKAYLRKYGNPRSIDDLQTHRCIEHFPTTYDKAQKKWRFIENNTIKETRIQKICQVGSYRAQLNLALAGAGLIRSPRFLVAEYIRTEKLVPLLPNIRSEDLYVILLYPQSAILPRRVNALIDFIKIELNTMINKSS